MARTPGFKFATRLLDDELPAVLDVDALLADILYTYYSYILS